MQNLQNEKKPLSVNTILEYKKEGKKLTMLTAYDYSSAKYFDRALVDMILVGDSLAMVALGHENTLKITLDEMIIFTKAVARGVKRALVVADMPFMSYHSDKSSATKNAGKLLQSGASAVKIEGGSDYMIDLTKHLTGCGIPVISHLGFTPQYINTIGGYRVQGKSFENTIAILEQAKKLQSAGAFAIVLEMMPEKSAKFITENLDIPTIGIGAGRFTSGQVLVCDDVLGKYDEFCPKFARKYADLSTVIYDAGKNFVEDVESGRFPGENEIFDLNDEEQQKLNEYCN